MKDDQTLLIIRNCFVKYLETVYSGKKEAELQKQTIECVLLNEMKASWEETKRVELLQQEFLKKQKGSLWNQSKAIIKQAGDKVARKN